MTSGRAQKISNAILSGGAGFASFVFSLAAFLFLTELNQQVVASIVAGSFCLLVCYIAAERPNSESARALAALSDRLMAVEDGDLVSPAPATLRRVNPKLAAAVDSLFTEVRASIENAHALGMYDPVTSLPNRVHFRSEVDKLLGELPSGARSAMLFVDLDRFKNVNDRLGHARGDQLLVMVANRLRVVVTAEFGETLRRRPLLARLAGDEFTLFFPEVPSLADVERVARRAVLAIAEPFEIAGHSIDIGASIGVAVVPDHGATVEALMRAADVAMYRAKSRGGAQHCLYDQVMAADHQARCETEMALSEAVQRGEFLLAFQPKVSLVTGEVAGAEALLRWAHPRDGMRLPASFIPVAECTGMITEIGDWAVTEIAALLSSWQREGAAQRISFNVSPRQLERGDFFGRLRQVLGDEGVPLSLIELELSESAAMQLSEPVLAELAALRVDGARVAMDDFGTGYSNVTRLQSLPLDRIKLDPSLIAGVGDCERTRLAVQALIQLIKSIDCEIVAEAVETAAQADLLRAMGCDTVQGYVFAQPMFEEEFLAWVANASRGARGSRLSA